MADQGSTGPVAGGRERVRLFERVGTVLASGSDLHETLELTASAVAEELDARHCTVSVLDGPRLRPLAAVSRSCDGIVSDLVRPEPFRAGAPLRSLLRAGHPRVVSGSQAGRLIPEWQTIVSVESLALVPARFREDSVGLLTLDWREGPRGDTRVLHALGSLLGSGIQLAMRAALVEELAQELEEISFADAVRADMASAEVGTVTELARRLNKLFAARDIDVEVLSLRFFHSRLVRRLMTKQPTPEEVEALQRSQTSPITLADGTFVMALRRGPKTLGALRLRVGDTRVPSRLLSAVADQVAELAHDLVLVTMMEATRQERATEQARNRILGRAQAIASARFDEIRRMASERADAATIAALPTIATSAGIGKMEIDWARAAAEWVPSGRSRQTLQQSLRALADALTPWNVDVTAEVRGRVRLLGPEVQRLLYYVAFSLLIDASTEGQCTAARVRLTFPLHHGRVQVAISDNGRPLALRGEWKARFSEIEQMVARAGGAVTTKERHPQGVQVIVALPG